MKLSKYLFAAIAVWTIQSQSSVANSKFAFDYDYCFFRNNDSGVFMEFYYSFYQNQLIFLKTDRGFEADGMINLDVFDKATNTAVIQRTFKVPVVTSDTVGYNRNSKLSGQLNLLLDTGVYIFRIQAADFNDTANNVSQEQEIEIRGFDKSNVSASSIQLATDIRKSGDSGNVFYKNTLEVIPNPSRLFGNNLTELFYYVELYNLTKENISGDYSVKVTVKDRNNNVLKSAEKSYKLKNDSRVEYGQLDVSGLKTDGYALVINVLDDKNNVKAESRNQFYVYNTDTSVAVSKDPSEKEFLSSEYVSYTEKKLDQEFTYASYLMSDLVRSNYSKLNNLDAKRKFMFSFWRNLDPNPLTPANEFKEDYLQRIKYANDNFGESFTDGWKTDRGRVYAVYGKYDDIERYPFESSTRAYEIWKYDKIQGGIIFVFVDIGSVSGNYILVHSTARTELHDEDWQRRINVKR